MGHIKKNEPIPLLIYGPKKSGSTLLQQLLDGHPHLLVFPGELNVGRYLFERKYLNPFHAAADYMLSNRNPLKDIGLLPGKIFDPGSPDAIPFEKIPGDLFRTPRSKNGVIKGLPEDTVSKIFNFDNYYTTLFENLSNKIGSSADFIRCEAAALSEALSIQCKPPSYFVMKEVGGNAGHIDAFFSYFLNSKVILIVRNPTAFLLSRMNFDKNRHGFKTSFIRKIKQVWGINKVYSRIPQLLNTYGKRRIIYIKYEDLVLEPEHTMERICDFLKIPFDDSIMIPSIIGQKAAVWTSVKYSESTDSKPGSFDIFTDSLERWEKKLTFLEKLISESLTFRTAYRTPLSYKTTMPKILLSITQSSLIVFIKGAKLFKIIFGRFKK